MGSIDERVVSMAFENATFERGVAQTMTTLQKLDSAIKNMSATSGLSNLEKEASRVSFQGPMSAVDKLRSKLADISLSNPFSRMERDSSQVTLEGANKAISKTQSNLDHLGAGSTFTDIEKAADRTDLSGLSNALDGVTSKFSILQGAASVALGNIATQAAFRGGAFLKSFAFGPVQQGLEEYQTNLNSIQTILANTEGQPVSGLEEVNKHLAELNHYSDQTIYNFSEMARNIGTFTAAGVDLDKSTQSIKGIANLAALSGSNSQQASTAMYQLSQAIAAGRVGLQDWNSVVNAGMGGAVFQKALLRTADNMGAIEKGALHIDKATGKATVNGQSFRESIMAKPGEKSWLTSEVLVETLKQFTGDMKEADLIAQGFSRDQAKAIMQQARTAKAAATEVKTLSQVFDVARETIGSGWSKTFQLIFGDFEESKKIFTQLSNFINNFINKSSDARNKLLSSWKKMGGRDELIAGLKQSFQDLVAILKPIKEAFRDIFPAQTSKSLFELTKSFRELMERLELSPQTAEQVRRIFAGLFAVLHIGWTIIKNVAEVIGDLLGVISGGSGGLLDFAGSVGDFLVSIDTAISKGGSLKGIFDGLLGAMQPVIRVVRDIGDYLANLFTGTDPEAGSRLGESFQKLSDAITPLGKTLDWAAEQWDKFKDAMVRIKEFFTPLVDYMQQVFVDLKDKVSEGLKGLTSDKSLKIIETGLLGAIVVQLKKALGGIDVNVGVEALNNLNGSLNALTGNLVALQSTVRAAGLFILAAAIGLLAASIALIARVDAAKMERALGAIAVGMGELVGAMYLLATLFKGGKAALGITSAAAALIAMAFAVDLLAVAMRAMSTMNWDEIARGVAGIGGALAAMAIGVEAMGPEIAIIGPALIPLAFGMNLLAAAMAAISELSWVEIAKGLAGVGGAMLAIGQALFYMGPSVTLVGPALVPLGIGLIFMSTALGTIGRLDLAQIVKGLFGMGVALDAIALGVRSMPATLLAQAAGLVVVGIALNEIAVAMALMGNLKLTTILKALLAMDGALTGLSIGLYAMTGTGPGALALLGAAAALAVLAPTLALLGVTPWMVLVKGLGAMVAILAVLAGVGAILAAPITAVGVALQALGLGMAAVAASVFIFAAAMKLFSEVGTKGLVAFGATVVGVIALIPKLLKDLILGFVEILEEIAKLLPRVAIALGQIIDTILLVLIENIPKLAIVIGELVDTLVVVLAENAPKLIAAGALLIFNLLDGLDQNLDPLSRKAGDVIAKFLGALTREAPRIIAAGAKFLVAYLQGIANNIGRVIAAGANVVLKFLEGVTTQLPKVMASAAKLILTYLENVGKYLPRFVKAGVDAIVNFLDGIANNLPRIVAAGARIIEKLIRGIGKAALDLVDTAAETLITFLNGLADAIRKYGPELRQAGWNIADAIIDGLIDGFKELGHKAVDAIKGVVDHLPKAARKVLGIFSPSRVFHAIGENVMYGLANGLAETASAPVGALGNGLKLLLQQTGGGREFGKFLSGEFVKGLEGGADDIRGAFGDLRAKLQAEQDKLRDQIETDKQNLKSLKEEEDPDIKKIQAAALALDQHQSTLKKSTAATKLLMRDFKDEQARLLLLAEDFKNVGGKLKEAQDELARLTQERDRTFESTQQQFGALPDFGEESKDQVAKYKESLRQQIEDTKKFMATLTKLRELGLDDATYQKLLSQGLKGQGFAEALLQGGKGGIDELNRLDADLASTATSMASTAASALYDAGIQAAQGLVKGLQNEQANIQAQMDTIANGMVAAIKKALGIRSPSRVMAVIGRFAAEGVAAGLTAASNSVTDAASGIGDDAAQAMSDSLAQIGTAVSSEIDIDPTITPVLDLTQVRKDAGKLSDLTNVVPITAAASYGQAGAISGEVQSNQDAATAAANAAAVTQFSFEQNNYSPEALSEIEVYRQTNNQLSQVRRALGLTG